MSTTRFVNAPAVSYSWQCDAACLGASADLFLGPDVEGLAERTQRESRALLFCDACPVRRPCLTHALGVPERHGIWGGTTPEQRRTVRRPDPTP